MWGKILFKDLVVLKKMVRFIGMSMAKKMIFTWDKVKAEESLRIGIVNSIWSKLFRLDKIDNNLINWLLFWKMTFLT